MYDENFKNQIECYGSTESRKVDMATALTGTSTLDVFQAIHVASSAAPYWRYGPLPEVKTCESDRLLLTYEEAGNRRVTLVELRFGGSSGPRWAWLRPYIAWCPLPAPCDGDSPSQD